MTIDIYSTYSIKITFLVSILCIPLLIIAILFFVFESWIIGLVSMYIYISIIIAIYIVGRVRTNNLLYRSIILYENKFELVDKYGNIDEFYDIYLDVAKPSNIGSFIHLLLSYEVSAELIFIDVKKNYYEGYISKKTYKDLLKCDYPYLRIE